jgi:hypothetical protein
LEQVKGRKKYDFYRTNGHFLQDALAALSSGTVSFGREIESLQGIEYILVFKNILYMYREVPQKF